MKYLRKANANLLKSGMTGSASESGLEENVTEEMEGQEEPGCLMGIVKNVMVIIGVVVATPIAYISVMYMLDKKGVDVESPPYQPLSLAMTQSELLKATAPPELADCSFHAFNGLRVIRCPNSTTSTQYPIHKNSLQNVIVIDNKNNP